MKKFPYAGKKFTLTMNNGLEVVNHYLDDGKTIEVEFLSGDLKGEKMQTTFAWKPLSDGNFLISWQENDKSTVVHCDNFEKKKSYAYYTTMKGDFYVMEGKIA
ncbi:hypothetical protein EDC48_101341 [Gibbsiella quercinecans]|uniref:MoaF-like domain-containing protein n=1 Tax=Gibbsiella quercinecans TaxID=929813 RepID=A0A250AW68_9GAMM|nr:hypothetical protein [Gibbsiella quercinecans]ATA18190.1 hypothetical protein AWC35_01825 [Gibbsiella quercinecans]RLM06759.1 hypothetical protein BIY30_15850 [Gibbsiella quercinecans]RLM12915.1 hypothetical protein BIY31_00625 [Gibbsiella quercinecans]TCT92530.1 hypothetical protein EDC48_101341 [Gibbsiella quercinecans]